MSLLRFRSLFLVLLLVAKNPLVAQTPGDWRPWFEGLSGEPGPTMHRYGSASSEGLHWAPLGLTTQYNQRPVAAWADGPAWQGVGFNGQIVGGLTWGSDHLEVSLMPEIWFAENRKFSMPASMNPPYGDAHRGAWDHPLRMGTTSLTRWDLGQSSISAKYGPARVSVGTENRIWGQSRQNSLLLSANGPGVPSVELAVDPLTTSWGTLEGHYIAGLLAPSGWQASSSQSGLRLWTGVMGAYTFPGSAPLTLTVARFAQASYDAFDWRDLGVPFLFKYSWGVDKYDQRLSLGYRWRFPSVGLELYGEWGRNDYSPKLLAWLQNFERTQAYVLGFRKALRTELGVLALEGELASVFLGPEGLINANGYDPYGADFYTHSILRQGYTIAGQDLGAAVGNGNSLSLAGVWVGDHASFKAELRRWVKDYSVLVSTLDRTAEWRIDVEYSLGLDARLESGDLTWFLGLISFYEISPFFQEGLRVWSFSSSVGLQYHL